MSELIPYTTVSEVEIDEFLNKREINRRHNEGITVIAYWMVAENVCTIYVHDARDNASSEFVVPNDQVGEWFDHPYAHKDAPPTSFRQGQLND